MTMPGSTKSFLLTAGKSPKPYNLPEDRPTPEEREKVLRLIQSYEGHHGTAAPLNWIREKSGLGPVRLLMILQELEDREEVSRRGRRYGSPEIKKDEAPPEIAPEGYNKGIPASVEAEPRKESTQEIPEPARAPGKGEAVRLWILRAVMLICGTGATYRSVVYTWMWFAMFHSRVEALVSSLIWVLFSVFSFQWVGLLWSRRRYLLSAGFFVLAVVTLTFSMGSTVAGLYNDMAWRVTERIQAEKPENRVLWEYREKERRIAENEADLDRDSRELETVNAILAGFDPASETYLRDTYTHRARKAELAAAIKQRETTRTTLREEQEALVADNAEADFSGAGNSLPPDFYSWLASVFPGASRDWLMFLSFLCPAVFFDLIASGSFFVVFFGGEEKRERRLFRLRPKKVTGKG